MFINIFIIKNKQLWVPKFDFWTTVNIGSADENFELKTSKNLFCRYNFPAVITYNNNNIILCRRITANICICCTAPAVVSSCGIINFRLPHYNILLLLWYTLRNPMDLAVGFHPRSKFTRTNIKRTQRKSLFGGVDSIFSIVCIVRVYKVFFQSGYNRYFQKMLTFFEFYFLTI